MKPTHFLCCGIRDPASILSSMHLPAEQRLPVTLLLGRNSSGGYKAARAKEYLARSTEALFRMCTGELPAQRAEEEED